MSSTREEEPHYPHCSMGRVGSFASHSLWLLALVRVSVRPGDGEVRAMDLTIWYLNRKTATAIGSADP